MPDERDPILRHRRELADQGVERTPEEMQEWFDDALEMFNGCGIEVPPEQLVELVEELKAALPEIDDEQE